MEETLIKNDIVIEKTCSFSGHRELRLGFNYDYLKAVIYKVIGMGYDTFLCGMAMGFDMEVFKLLEEVRKEKNIRIIACIPCLNQNKNYNEKDKKEYQRMLISADRRILMSNKYTQFCMLKRNMYMVDNSSLLIAYLRTSKGGTYNTIEYAKKKERRIIKV